MRPALTRIGAAAALGTALLATAAPAPAAVVSLVRFRGDIALASWSDCPSAPVGSTCSEISVLASPDRGSLFERTVGHWRVSQLKYYEGWYEVVAGDEGPEVRYLGERWGGTVGTDAPRTISVAARLRSASATGEVPVRECHVGGDCIDAGSIQVRVSWTAAGPLARIAERERWGGAKPADPLYTTWTTGWHRAATATAAVEGRPVTLPPVGERTELLDVSQGEMHVVRGGV